MQQISAFIRAEGVGGIIVDEFNSPNDATISILRGMQAQIKLTLFKDRGTTKFEAADLENFASWRFTADVDYSESTTVKLAVDSTGISVGEGGTITIDLTETNTAELAAEIGATASITLTCELLGYAEGIETPGFALHFPIRILNRIWHDGAALPVGVPTFAQAVSASLAAMFASVETPTTVDGVFSWIAEITTKLKGE